MKPRIGSALAIMWMGAALIGRVQGASGVYVSNDRGVTWRATGEGLPTDTRVNALGIETNLFLAGTDDGLFVSRNEGAAWARATSDEARERITSIGAIKGLLAAGTDKGILLSTNGGEGWARAAAFPAVKVRCIVNWNGALAIGTDANGVWVSRDQGKSWQTLANGLPAGAQIFALAAVGKELFAGLYSQGLVRWNETNGVWRKAGEVRPLALAAIGETLIAGHNPGGLFWSDDFGESWHRPGRRAGLGEALLDSEVAVADPVGEAPIWELHAGNNVFVAGAGDGVFVSRDLGRSWERARAGLPTTSPGISFASWRDTILAGISISQR